MTLNGTLIGSNMSIGRFLKKHIHYSLCYLNNTSRFDHTFVYKNFSEVCTGYIVLNQASQPNNFQTNHIPGLNLSLLKFGPFIGGLILWFKLFLPRPLFRIMPVGRVFHIYKTDVLQLHRKCPYTKSFLTYVFLCSN